MHENKKRTREDASLDVELGGFDSREQFQFSDVIDFGALEAAFQEDFLEGLEPLSRGLGMENVGHVGNMGFLGDPVPLSHNTPVAGNNLGRSNSAPEINRGNPNISNGGSSNAMRNNNSQAGMSSGAMKRPQAPVQLDIANDVGKIFNDCCVYQSTVDGWAEVPSTAWEYEELDDINLDHAPDKESPSSPSSQSPRNQNFGLYQQPQEQLLNQQTPQHPQVQNQEPTIPTQSRYPPPMYQPPQAQQYLPQQAHPPMQQNMRSYPYQNQPPAHNMQIQPHSQHQQQPYPQMSQPQNMKLKYDSNHYLNFGKQTDNNKPNNPIQQNHNLPQNPNGSLYLPFETNHIEAYDRTNNWNRPLNTTPANNPVDPNTDILFLKKKTAHLEAVIAQQDKKIEQILEQLNRISRKVKF